MTRVNTWIFKPIQSTITIWKLMSISVMIFCQYVASQDPKCNPNDGNSTCYCKESLVTGRYKIFCQDIFDTDELRKSIQAYSGLPIELLELSNANLPNIPENVFNGLDIHSLDLEDINLSSIFLGNDPQNSPLKYLNKSLLFFRALDIHINGTIDWNLFHETTSLKTLELSSVTCVGYENWNSLDLKELKNLIILDGDIVELPSKALSGLTNIQDIIINYSKLTKITRDVFPRPANMLKLLQLSENEIISLPEDLFTDMPNLKFVSIDGNRLQTLSEATLAPVISHLRGVSVSGNRFTCDKKLFWIMSWNASNFNSDIKRITCDTPKFLHNRQLQSLSEEDFHE